MAIKVPVYTQKLDVDTIDLHDIFLLADEDYRSFVREGGLIYLDSHGALRVASCDSGLATTREQLDILIQELRSLRSSMSPRSDA